MLPEKYMHALNKFLENWKTRSCVEGAFLTGSAVTAYFSAHSDIDVYIVLSSRARWRERGNMVLDGVLIEYFANPTTQIRKYFEEDFRKNRRTMARMLVMGKIIFDRHGVIARLRKEAEKWMGRKFGKLSRASLEAAKYGMWDELENLKDLYAQKALNFELLYHKLLVQVLEWYAKFLRSEIPPISKLVKFFTDEEFRREYRYEEFPDKRFAEIFISCLRAGSREEKMSCARKLVSYTLGKMHGFEINGWRLRSKV